MNEYPHTDQASDSTEAWEMHVQQAAQDFPYPPTPDLAGRRRTSRPANRRSQVGRLAQGAAAVLLLFSLGVMAVPQLRAAVLDFLQIGAVRIFMDESTATRTPMTATARPTFFITDAPDEWMQSEETSLDSARARFGLPLLLPGYPASLGEPDRVLIPDGDLVTVILVWHSHNADGDASISLHYLPSTGFLGKYDLDEVTQTHVNERPAVWMTSPHRVELFDSRGQAPEASSWFVNGNVLIWDDGRVTYRLETSLSLDEAIRVAESLR